MNSFVFTYSLSDIDLIANKVAGLLDKGIVLFEGQMGAGKTTFISALLKVLGSEDSASSPTFSIVNEYNLPKEKAYHFDFYRINSLEEALNFGVEEYLDAEDWVFIEWPDKIRGLIPDEVQKITVTTTEHNKRSLKLTINKRSLTEINAMTDSKF